MPKIFEYIPSGGLTMGGGACFIHRLHYPEKPKKNDFYYERKAGLERRGDGKGFVLKDRVIDRSKTPPWYTEHVVDSITGEVIRHIEEPLKDHINRGSAKKQPKPNQ